MILQILKNYSNFLNDEKGVWLNPFEYYMISNVTKNFVSM